MAIFNSKLLVYQRVNHYSHLILEFYARYLLARPHC